MQASQLDRAVGRLLFVNPRAAEAHEGKQAENVMGLSLVFSGIRCTLQYMILPFVLPVIGVAGSFAVSLTLGINVLAIVALVASLRRMWTIGYEHRWRYFAIAVPAFVVLVAFLVLDIITIAGGGTL